MNGHHHHPAAQALQERLAGRARVEARLLDVEDACRQYTAEGYEVSTQLRAFLAAYGELTVTWPFRQSETYLEVAVEEALDIPDRNVRLYGKRLGQAVLPVGIAFSTEEAVLLAESGEIFFGGDAGLQRVAHDFDAAVEALVTDDWDKTFF